MPLTADSSKIHCPSCRGSGLYPNPTGYIGAPTEWLACPDCQGTGRTAFILIRKKPKWAYVNAPTWVMRCTPCKAQWGYYEFGAILGSAQEHIRRFHARVC